MLSYASGDSNQGALIDTIREATAKAKSLCSEYPIEGPIQFDAAVDADVAAIKYKGSDSEVAGHATVCVFPDLNSGSRAAWNFVAPRRRAKLSAQATTATRPSSRRRRPSPWGRSCRASPSR